MNHIKYSLHDFSIIIIIILLTNNEPALASYSVTAWYQFAFVDTTMCKLVNVCFRILTSDHSHYLMLSLDYTQTVDSLKLLLELVRDRMQLQLSFDEEVIWFVGYLMIFFRFFFRLLL